MNAMFYLPLEHPVASHPFQWPGSASYNILLGHIPFNILHLKEHPHNDLRNKLLHNRPSCTHARMLGGLNIRRYCLRTCSCYDFMISTATYYEKRMHPLDLVLFTTPFCDVPLSHLEINTQKSFILSSWVSNYCLNWSRTISIFFSLKNVESITTPWKKAYFENSLTTW